MNKLEHATRSITSTITNPSYLSYGLIGISSVILGYYTLFDDNIDSKEPDPTLQQQPSVQPTQEPSMQPTQEPSMQPTQEPSVQQGYMQGGKKQKNKKTKRRL